MVSIQPFTRTIQYYTNHSPYEQNSCRSTYYKEMKVHRESDQYTSTHELSTITSSMATDEIVGNVREVLGNIIDANMSTGTAKDLLIDEMILHSHCVVSSRKQSISSSSATVLSSNMPVPVTNHKTSKMSMNPSSDSSSYMYDNLTPTCASASGSRPGPWTSPMKNSTITSSP
eukprot:CAMPEP_0170852820 /NCGR_PEP_ID=MMETSP0734-20130129/12132_1 /TAXON_ID=186038 /ORGANISM="Fragilariopsis kerguelensis, Strain L26-C5" /LENGTH=172 /DNA_ID=CAMNT_0011223355 /DNA_START=197 /DNA_END=712 /DNA_ORIENTATION=-